MALHTKVGTLTTPAVTGTQVISGLGFQPKAIIFSSASLVGTSYNAAIYHAMYGFATSPSAQYVHTSYVSNSASGRTTLYTNAIAILGPFSAQASLSSIDANGFTLNWSQVGAQADVHYIALGGDDVINAKAGTYPLTGSVGSQAISGVGFQPNTILFHQQVSTTGSGAAYRGLGVATPQAQWAEGTALYQSARDAVTIQLTDSCYVLVNNSGVTYGQASVSSFNPNGFTLNWVDASQSGWGDQLYLALELETPAVAGWFTQPSVTGSQVISGFGAVPKSMLMHAYGLEERTTRTFDSSLFTGFIDADYQVGMWRGFDHGVLYSDQGRQAIGNMPLFGDITSGDPTSLGTTALDSDGFTINWSATEQPAPRQLLYLAFVEAPHVGITHDGEYALSADSTATHDANRDRTTHVDMSGSSDIDLLAGVLKIASPYAYVIASDATFINTRVKADAVWMGFQTSGLSYSVSRVRNAWPLIGTADASLAFAADTLIDDAYSFAALATFTYNTSGTAESVFLLTADSAIQLVANTDRNAAYTMDAELLAALTPNRVLSSGVEADILASVGLDSNRLRGSDFDATLVSTLDYAALLTRGGRYALVADADLTMDASRQLRGIVVFDANAAMDFTASPRLSRTFEHVFARVLNTLPTAKRVPFIRTHVHPLKRGEET